MRRLLVSALVLALAALLLVLAGGCSGSTSGGGDSSTDTGGPSEAGDGPTDAIGEHREGGPKEGGDGPSDGPKDGMPEAMTKFTIGGTVTGLAGTGLVLQNNGGDDLTITMNGAFTFATPLAAGATYAVTVATQPGSPTQVCTVTGGSGTVGTSDVTSMVVNCAANTYTISGTVYGLAGTVVLQDNGGDNLTIGASAPFVFPTPIPMGATYDVTVLTQPTGQTCSVTNGSGTVGSADVTNVSVICSNVTYTIGGTVTGLSSKGLVLQNNGADDLKVGKSGAFTFSKGLPSGASYTVTISAQPATQYCVLTGGTGTIVGSNITSIKIKCAAAVAYTIGGTLTGIVTGDAGANPVVLQDVLADNLSLNADGTFTFATPIYQGHPYAVTVLTNPSSPMEYCSVSNGSGTVVSGNITNVAVTCYTAASGGCGRFSNGFTGSWDTTAANVPSTFGFGSGMSDYLPAGGTATVYVNSPSAFQEYDSVPNSYTVLPTPPSTLAYYGTTAWFAGSLYSITGGNVVKFDTSAGTWSTAATGVVPDAGFFAFESQTTADNAGSLWSFSNTATLVKYDVGSATATTVAIPTPLTGYGSEPRITYDACTGLLYFANYESPLFYSYDPVSGIQTPLSNPFTSYEYFYQAFCGDRSGHIFAMSSLNKMYQYTIATDTWIPMPTGPGFGTYGSPACGVGSDGMLYAFVSSYSYTGATMYRILLN